MAQTKRSMKNRGADILGALFVVVVAVRAAADFFGSQSLIPAMLCVGLFAIYYGVGLYLSSRLPWHRLIYFPVQTGLVILLTRLQPFMDVSPILYIVLSLQTVRAFSRRYALAWVLLYIILLTATQILGLGLFAGLGLSLLMIAVGAFMISGTILYYQAQTDHEQSLLMLTRLRGAHQKLQESASKSEELAAARERNRLARELHDSVSQMIFSITLVTRAAQLLLERNPSQVVGQLDRLQEMTSAALGQLRLLISQMRPPQK